LTRARGCSADTTAPHTGRTTEGFTMFTVETVIARATAFTAATTDAEITRVYGASMIRADLASFATHAAVFHACRVRSAKSIAALVGKSEPRVSRMRRGYALFVTTGLTGDALTDKRLPWSALNADAMVKYLTSDAGKDALASIVDADGDAAKIDALFAVVVPGRESAPVDAADALCALLSRAADASDADALTLTDAHRVIVGDALARIVANTGAAVALAV
jgi:hypothetical protein